MSTIFFGDSITEGVNSKSSFTKEFNDAINMGISGTTIGEYSIYPVDGLSLLQVYDCYKLRKASRVFLEYGCNDVASVMCGFTSLNNVIISFVKALDGIRQINGSAEIYFLSIADNADIIREYANYQCDYLKNDYFKGYDFVFPASKWAEIYIAFIEAVKKRIPVIPMIDDTEFLSHYLSDDKLHPNELGHGIIGATIGKKLVFTPYMK